MRIGETGDVLEVPSGAAVVEIPWDRIRCVADPEFRAHLADRAAERRPPHRRTDSGHAS